MEAAGGVPLVVPEEDIGAMNVASEALKVAVNWQSALWCGKSILTMEGNHCTPSREFDEFHELVKPHSKMEEDVMGARKMLTFAYKDAGQVN